MAQQLQVSSAAGLPAINLREPVSLLLLPPWLGEQVAAVSDLGAGRTTIDPVTRTVTARVSTIPASKMPTGPQRSAIMQRIEDLHAAARPGPLAKSLGYIGELVTEYAPARLDEDTAAVKIEAYEDAVGDLPAWAIREAMRRWRRGEVSDDRQDLKFAPKPARLRHLTQSITAIATGQAMRLQRVLDAEPEETLSEAQLEANAKAFGDLMVELRNPKAQETPAGTQAHVRAQALATLERMKAEATTTDTDRQLAA